MKTWDSESGRYLTEDELDQAEMVDAEGEGDAPKKGKKPLKKVEHVFKKIAKKRYVFQGEEDND